MFTQAVKNVFEFTQEKLLKHCSISQSGWFSRVSAATAAKSGYRDRPLRSSVTGHLLSCLTPPICMGLFLPNKNLNLVLSVPSNHLTEPPPLFPSPLTNRKPTPYSSLQAYVCAASCLVLFLSTGLCGHQKLLPCLTAFTSCGLSNSALGRT